MIRKPGAAPYGVCANHAPDRRNLGDPDCGRDDPAGGPIGHGQPGWPVAGCPPGDGRSTVRPDRYNSCAGMIARAPSAWSSTGPAAACRAGIFLPHSASTAWRMVPISRSGGAARWSLRPGLCSMMCGRPADGSKPRYTEICRARGLAISSDRSLLEDLARNAGPGAEFDPVRLCRLGRRPGGTGAGAPRLAGHLRRTGNWFSPPNRPLFGTGRATAAASICEPNSGQPAGNRARLRRLLRVPKPLR